MLHNNAPILDVDYFSMENIQDPRLLNEQIRKLGPVVWIPRNKMYITVSKEAAEQIFIHPSFSSRNSTYGNDVLATIREFNASLGMTEEVDLLFTMDGDKHTKKRAEIRKDFRLDDITTKWRPRTKEIMSELVDAMEAQFRGDVMRDIAIPGPTRVIAEFLGLPYKGIQIDGRNKISWMRHLTYVTTRFLGHTRGDRFDVAEAEFFANHALTGFSWINDEIQYKRDHPSDDLLSQLVKASTNDFHLNNDINLLLLAGNFTTTSAMGFLLYHLAENPEAYQLLRGDPQKYTPRAIEETLRIDPPFMGGYRYVAENTNFQSIDMKEGEQLFFGLRGIGRDHRAYEEPDKFDITRVIYDKTDGKINHHAHLTFGLGKHRCIGEWLARMEMHVLLEAVTERYKSISLPAGFQRELYDMPIFSQLTSLPVVYEKI